MWLTGFYLVVVLLPLGSFMGIFQIRPSLTFLIILINFNTPFNLCKGQTDRQTYIQTDRQTNRQTDRQTNRQTDRQTYRQTERQIDR